VLVTPVTILLERVVTAREDAIRTSVDDFDDRDGLGRGLDDERPSDLGPVFPVDDAGRDLLDIVCAFESAKLRVAKRMRERIERTHADRPPAVPTAWRIRGRAVTASITVTRPLPRRINTVSLSA
jgi:hypothetical protein